MKETISKDKNLIYSLKVRDAYKAITSVISNYGYMRVRLPIYEYFSVLQSTSFNFAEENTIQFIDRHSGATLVLRPDFTPQICRLAANMLEKNLPLRLCYRGPVFRSAPKDSGAKSEIYQMGWELFGDDSIYADAEIISLCNESLKKVGLSDFVFTINDTIFLNRIYELLVSFEGVSDLKNAIALKNSSLVQKHIAPASIAEGLKSLLLALPLSFGGCEVLDSLEKLSSFDNKLLERLKYLKELYSILLKAGVSEDAIVFDLAESRGLEYYTGLNFEIMIDGSGSSLGGGGRYDNLMVKFASSHSPACGAALYIDTILPFISFDKEVGSFDYLALGSVNFERSQELRRQGNSVLFCADSSKKELLLGQYKFKNIVE